MSPSVMSVIIQKVKNRKAGPRAPQVQQGDGDEPHGITGPADGVGMKPGMPAHPGDLLGGAQEPVDGEPFRAEHQQDGERNFKQNGGIWGGHRVGSFCLEDFSPQKFNNLRNLCVTHNSLARTCDGDPPALLVSEWRRLAARASLILPYPHF